jgi:hypothetical protein
VAQAAESIELWLDELFDLPGKAPRASLNG